MQIARRKRPAWLVFFLSALAAGTLTVCVAGLSGGFSRPPRPVPGHDLAFALFAVIVFPIAFLCACLVHECGHLLGSKLFGGVVIFVIAGPLQLMRFENRLRLGWNRRVGLYGGAALAVPTAWRGAGHYLRQSFWMLAGGPLASLSTGTLLLFLASAMHRDNGMHATTLTALALFMAGTMSLGLGLVTLGPGAFTATGTSDGARIRRITRARRSGSNSSAPACDPLSAVQHFALAHRPRNWDPRLVELLEAYAADAPSLPALLLLHRHALDVNNMIGAERFLRRAVAMGPLLSHEQLRALAIDQAIYAALWRGDAAWARAALDTLGVGPSRSAEALVAEAAIACAIGRTLAARQILTAAHAAAWREIAPAVMVSHAPAVDRILVAYRAPVPDEARAAG